MILAIETSTTFASVAVVAGDEVRSTAESEARTHSEKLIGLIDEALRAAGTSIDEIDGVAVGAGPGSFTGLRIGMATAKGLCFAAEKPLWVVSSLAALALEARAPAKTVLVPVLDARRKEVFAGFYVLDERGLVSIADEIVIGPRALADAVMGVVGERQAVVFGEGAELYRALLPELSIDGAGPRRPSAAAVGRLAGRGAAPENIARAAPVYIRKSEAEIRYPDGNPGGSYAPIKS